VAVAFLQGWVELGGEQVTTDGRTSTTNVQRSFPLATVSVFLPGTGTLATIYADELLTPMANPFIADTDAHWGFWVDEGSYDITFSNAGIPFPYTLFDVWVRTSSGLPDPGSNGIVVRTAPNTAVTRSITPTNNETTVTNGNGVSGNPTIGLASFLEFSSKTINGGIYNSPQISNFGNAIHNHENSSGGGQLNATNVFSAGTVPIPRLPGMVGASGIAAGQSGLVPQPLAGDNANFLRGDGVWATAGGGGGGTPGGANGTVQYNNAGAFNGASGATSDGTNITFTSGTLRATSPRVTTAILDSNGNQIVGLSPTGGAVNSLSISNAAGGGIPAIIAVGTDTNINVNIVPKGTGLVHTPGNVRVSNNAPSVILVDVNDSKQATLALIGNNLSLINDTGGVTPLNINMTDSSINFIGDITLTNTSPEINMVDSGGSTVHLLNDAGSFFIYQTPGSDLIQGNLTTQVVNFPQIPTGPGVNPTTSNQLTRKAYVDSAISTAIAAQNFSDFARLSTATSAFFWNWFIIDPSSWTTGIQNLPKYVCPDGTAVTLTKSKLVYSSGVHFGGGDVRFTFQRRTAASGWTSVLDFGTIAFNDANSAQNVVYELDFGDVSLSPGDSVTCYISFRGGTITEAFASIGVCGTQRLTG
jgi:hypothetical protein